jgi:hypothetical protein
MLYTNSRLFDRKDLSNRGFITFMIFSLNNNNPLITNQAKREKTI